MIVTGDDGTGAPPGVTSVVPLPAGHYPPVGMFDEVSVAVTHVAGDVWQVAGQWTLLADTGAGPVTVRSVAVTVDGVESIYALSRPVSMLKGDALTATVRLPDSVEVM